MLPIPQSMEFPGSLTRPAESHASPAPSPSATLLGYHKLDTSAARPDYIRGGMACKEDEREPAADSSAGNMLMGRQRPPATGLAGEETARQALPGLPAPSWVSVPFCMK